MASNPPGLSPQKVSRGQKSQGLLNPNPDSVASLHKAQRPWWWLISPPVLQHLSTHTLLSIHKRPKDMRFISAYFGVFPTEACGFYSLRSADGTGSTRMSWSPFSLFGDPALLFDERFRVHGLTLGVWGQIHSTDTKTSVWACVCVCVCVCQRETSNVYLNLLLMVGCKWKPKSRVRKRRMRWWWRSTQSQRKAGPSTT